MLKVLKLGIIISFIYIFLVVLGYIFIEQSLSNDSKDFITNIEDRINSSLRYDKGRWDTSLYNSDPLTPYPNASTTFPIYILTQDGYVLERSKPISGILDTSDFKHLAQFQTPTTLNTVINENWRVLAKVLKSDGQDVGVVMVAYYNPDSSFLPQIDTQLMRNLSIIEDQLVVNESGIDLSKLDERKVDYNLSFEIVSKANKVLLNNGRTPSFIDPSYVEEEAQNSGEFRVVWDKQTNTPFLIKSITIKDSTNEEVGIIVVGRSVEFVNKILLSYALFTVIVGVILIPFATFTLNLIIMSEVVLRLRDAENQAFTPKKVILFNSKSSVLTVDTDDIPIVYASNQYYLLKTLFKHPTKRFENDELLESLGEELNDHNFKKIYDASIAINKKLGFKLINYTDKTFMINPDLVGLLHKKK